VIGQALTCPPVPAVTAAGVKMIDLTTPEGQWLVWFFYPKDFTFV